MLGPLLFIIYSNGFPHSITYCNTILFADTTVYLTHMDPHMMCRHVYHDLQISSDWPKANQLSVNPSKTKFILFSRGGGRTAHDLSIYINDEKLEQVHTTKFLGLNIDEQLPWGYHIEHCKSKVSKGVP